MNDKQQIINAVLEQAKESNGKKQLNCAEAFELARQFEVKIIEIGRICNQNNVRICNCQLGCFA